MATVERQGREMLLGGLIILALVTVAVGLFALDRIIASFRNPDRFHAVLPEAPKLTVGTRVWIGGKDVGEVVELEFMPFRGDSTARLVVAMEFPHEYHEHLRQDSRVRLTSERMIGVPVIDLIPGTAAAPPLAHGDTLYMDQLVTLPALMAKAATIKGSFDTALVQVRALGPQMGKRMDSFQPVMQNLTAAQGELTSLMDDMRAGPAAQLMADGRLAAELGSLQRTVAQLGPAFGAARARMTDTQSGVGPSLERMQGNAERLSRALADLQAMMKENNGTFYRMSADSALMKTLHETQAQLDSLIMEAKKNPLRFVF